MSLDIALQTGYAYAQGLKSGNLDPYAAKSAIPGILAHFEEYNVLNKNQADLTGLMSEHSQSESLVKTVAQA